MTKWKAYLPFIYRGSRTYQWRTDGARWELRAGSRVVAKVVPDLTYQSMWRIDLGDGALSDMVNLPEPKMRRRGRATPARWPAKLSLARRPRVWRGGLVSHSLECQLALRSPQIPHPRRRASGHEHPPAGYMDAYDSDAPWIRRTTPHRHGRCGASE
jgi:hypothetical protein